MPLTYQNPWMGNAAQDASNSLGEVLLRVPQIRAQALMMQQQMALEQQKIANEQQYQQGMLGYHNASLTQSAPLVKAQTGEANQKLAEQQKILSLAEMFGKAQRHAMKLPSWNNYQGGPTIANYDALNQGDLVQAISTLQALRPQGDPMGTSLQLQAQQQQGQLSSDQLNALITRGHINTPHPESLGFNLGPGQNRYSPTGRLITQGPPALTKQGRPSLDQFILNMQQGALKNAVENNQVKDPNAMQSIWNLTNLLSNAQSQNTQLPTIKTKAEFDKLPSGTKYVGPSGKVATKP